MNQRYQLKDLIIKCLLAAAVIFCIVTVIVEAARIKPVEVEQTRPTPTEMASVSPEQIREAEEAAGKVLESAFSGAAEAVKESGVTKFVLVTASKGVEVGKKIFRGDYLKENPELFAESEIADAIEIPEGFEAAEVINVSDGDTLHVNMIDKDGNILEEDVYIRALSINTPESDAAERVGYAEATDEGKEASHYTKSLIESGQIVFLSKDHEEPVSDSIDPYGRYIRLIWLDIPKEGDADNDNAVIAKTLNTKLLIDGMAEVMIIQPNGRYEALFTSIAAN